MLQQKMEQKILCLDILVVKRTHIYIYTYIYMCISACDDSRTKYVCMHNYTLTCITSRHLVLRDLCNDAQVPYLSSSGMPE